MKAYLYLLITVLSVCIIISCSEKKTTQIEQVAKPSFSLPSGVYTAQDTVAITCVTPDTHIYFTVDGKEPDESSIRYEEPIVFNKTTLLKARAYNDFMEPSEVNRARYTMDVTNINLKYVSGGTFIMGNTLDEEQPDELPTHQVKVSPFLITRYETQQIDWQCIMGYATIPVATGWEFKPVTSINWYEALIYCNLRSLAENLTPVYTIKGTTNPDEWGPVPTYYHSEWDAVVCDWNAKGYRLPTEAEWEFAARGGSNGPDYRYSGSNRLCDVGWYLDNCTCCNSTKRNKLANGLGLCDMSGNVWEWCWDRMDCQYYVSSPLIDPHGPDNGIRRGLRGGSWKSAAVYCRVSERNCNVSYYRSNCVGFRIVRNGH